jgi:hypothetical protein
VASLKPAVVVGEAINRQNDRLPRLGHADDHKSIGAPLGL